MTLKNIMEKLKIVLSSASHQLQDKLSSGMPSWKTVLSFIVYPYRLLFNVVFNHQLFHPKDLMNWNCGIVFLITLLLLLGIFLTSHSGKYIGKDKKWHYGKYLFTVDWAHPDSNILDADHSEIPHEHKCAHILALDDGNFAAQPNNRIMWNVASFTVKDNIPDWKVQTTEWNVEDDKSWRTEDTDKFFYEMEEKKND
jgi:hypothetical protein